MPRFSHGKCFYCRLGFNKPVSNQKGMRDLNPTIDHIYPFKAKLPPGLRDRHSINAQVRCCYACNRMKGKMHPLTWLTYCPSAASAADLAELLLKFGEPTGAVALALKGRERLGT